MTDVVTVYTPLGRPMTQLPVSVLRTWKIERTIDKARGQFTISANDPKAQFRYLRNRNLILVQSDQPGIPDWIGMISDKPTQAGGIITIRVTSIEAILDDCYTNEYKSVYDIPGEVFRKLLGYAQSRKTIPLSDTENIADGGEIYGKIYHAANIYQAANELAEETGYYWWFSAELNGNNLELVPNFTSKRRTTLRPTHLVEDGNFHDVQIEEANEVKNSIRVYGRFPNWSYPLFADAQDEESLSTVGRIEHVVMASDIEDQGQLNAAAQSLLEEMGRAKLAATGYVTSAPFPRVGDEIPVQLIQGGYLIAKRPNPMTMRIVKATYSPDDNTLAVRAEEIIDYDN